MKATTFTIWIVIMIITLILIGYDIVTTEVTNCTKVNYDNQTYQICDTK